MSPYKRLLVISSLGAALFSGFAEAETDSSGPRGVGTWAYRRTSGSEYFQLRAGEPNTLVGERLGDFSVPNLGDVQATVLLASNDDQLTGTVTWVDPTESGGWTAPARWELSFSDNHTLSGRWELIDVELEATKPEEFVIRRVWRARKLTRIPRLGGYDERYEAVARPKAFDLSSGSLASLAGTYLGARDEQVSVSHIDDQLELRLGSNLYRLTFASGRLEGSLVGASVPCAIELTATAAGLAGRVAWRDYDAAYRGALTVAAGGAVIAEGWSPLALRRLEQVGNAPVDASDTPAKAGPVELDTLSGLWLLEDRDGLVELTLEGDELALSAEGLELSNLKRSEGLLVAEQRTGGLALRWELGLEEGRLVGRRQVAARTADGAAKVALGWTPVSLTPLDRAGPAAPAKQSADTPPRLTGASPEALNGAWLDQLGSRVTLSSLDGRLTLQRGETRLRLERSGGLLRGVEDIGGERLAWELGGNSRQLSGRRQWTLKRRADGSLLRSGWVSFELRRILTFGERRGASGRPAEPSRVPALASIAGRYRSDDGRDVELLVDGGGLSLTGLTAAPLGLSADPEGELGLIRGEQPSANGLAALEWRLSFDDGVLLGTRSWIEAVAESGGRILDRGTSAVRLTRVIHAGPDAGAEAPSLTGGAATSRLKLVGPISGSGGAGRISMVDGRLRLRLDSGERVDLEAPTNTGGKVIEGVERWVPEATNTWARPTLLRWQLIVRDGSLAARREWVDQLVTGEVLRRGFVSASFDMFEEIGAPGETKAGELDSGQPVNDAQLSAWWLGPERELFRLSREGQLVELSGDAGTRLTFKETSGIYAGQEALSTGRSREWRLSFGASETASGLRFWSVVNRRTDKVVRQGAEGFELRALARVGPPTNGDEPAATLDSDPSLITASLSGIWKLGGKGHLRLRELGRGRVSGTLVIGKARHELALTLRDGLYRGHLIWHTSNDRVRLSFELTPRPDGGLEARSEWVVLNPESGAELERGWRGLSFKRLPRIG